MLVKYLEMLLAEFCLKFSIVFVQFLTHFVNILIFEERTFDLSFPHRLKCFRYLDPVYILVQFSLRCGRSCVRGQSKFVVFSLGVEVDSDGFQDGAKVHG